MIGIIAKIETASKTAEIVPRPTKAKNIIRRFGVSSLNSQKSPEKKLDMLQGPLQKYLVPKGIWVAKAFSSYVALLGYMRILRRVGQDFCYEFLKLCRVCE